MEQQMLTAQEAADVLKVKKATVYEMIKRGTLPAVKIGKQVRIDRKILESMLNPLAAPMESPNPGERIGEGVVLCGQDSCLNIIANYISTRPGARTILRSYAGSYNSLNLLYQGKVDIATSHLWDSETDTYNFPFITRLLPGMPVVVVRLLGRDMGLYVKRGNPKNITDLESLRGGKISIVNREKGSGTRILMDQKLKMLKINAADIPGYDREYQNHLSIAGAVARGEADLGMGAETAARQVDGVDFLPIQKEWYDLVFPESRAKEATFRLLMDYLTTDFAKEIAATGHYDLSQTGQVFHL